MNAFTLTQFVTLAFSVVAAPAPLGTGFTYQGQLKEDGSPAIGEYDLQFRLFDAVVAGIPVGPTIQFDNVSVTNGLFNVVLDFGARFDGEARWLEVGVHPGAQAVGDHYVLLTRRQALSATPYALGLRLPLSQTVTTASDAINVTNAGTGDCGQFNITDPSNSGEAVEGRTAGSGAAIAGVNSGAGRAGYFETTDTVNNNAALYATTNGTTGIGVQGLGHTGVRGSTTDADGYGGVFNGAGFLGDGQALLVSGDSEFLGSVEIGQVADTQVVRLHIVGGTDAGPAGGGYLVAGVTTSLNISIDNNEIMARDNGGTSTLYVNNNGGDVVFGGAIDIGLESVSRTNDFTGSFAVSCPTGKNALGGGCYCPSGAMVESRPTFGGWVCDCTTGGATAYAVCANVK